MTQGGPQGELDLSDYLSILRRRWLWFLLPLLTVPALAYAYSSQQADSFSATAEVLLGETAAQDAVGAASQSTSFRDRLLENELSLAKSDAAFDEVSSRFEVDVDDVPEATVRADGSADVLVFSASSTSARTAADTANAWAEVYVELKQTQAQESILGAITQLEARLLELQEQRDDVRAELNDLEDDLVRASDEDKAQAQLLVDREESRISGQVALIDAQISAVVDSINDLELSGELALSGSARVVNRANVPVTPTNPPPSRNIALGVVVGAILGAALALLRENLDRNLRTTDDLDALGILPLGSFPKSKKTLAEQALVTVDEPNGPAAEAAQKLQAAVQFMIASDRLRSIVITSPRQGDGKTTTSSNLAIAMSRAGKRTLLIDADLRRPRLHKVFDIPQSPGLTNVALDSEVLTKAATTATSVSENLVIVPAGELPPHPAGFIATEMFGDAVDDLETMADITIIDAAPVLPVADTLSLASHADGVLVVARAGTTTSDDLNDSIAAIRNAGGTVIGAVLVGVTQKGKSHYYQYDSDDQKLDRMGPPGSNGSSASHATAVDVSDARVASN